ncbi:hypothetical protein [Cetobacterium sp.]
MKRIFLMIFIMLKAILAYGAISISPIDYDIDLLNKTHKVFTLRNVGNVEATYTVELDKNYDLGKYISYKKEIFKLLPGEKKEIILKIDVNEKKLSNQEYIGKLYILEKQQVKNMTYETNTILNIYGYVGELKEEFILKSLEKKGDVLIGELKNESLRKVDVLFRVVDENENILITKKIRVLKDKKFNLFELGLMEEFKTGKKIVLESRDTKIEKEI